MDRKSESKSNLNESLSVPLLDDEANKEKIELETKATDADEKATESAQDAVDAAKKKKDEEKERKRQQKLEEEEKKKQAKLEKQKKKEEEKENKKQKAEQQKAEKAEQKKAAQEAAKTNGTANGSGGNVGAKNWNPYNQFTVGINLLDRDERSVNEHVNVNFEDIIGEPDATQGWDGVYSVSFGVFQFIRFWVYRLLMIILSVPFALLWALVFALLTLVSVWILTPAFRVLDILFYFVHRLWNATVRTLLDPIFLSISLARQNGTSALNHTPVPTFSGKVVYQSGSKYNQLSTSETQASYTKTDEEGQVALNIESSQH